MDWYTSEIIDGLTKLLSLSLDRAPASDLVQITAATWIDATTSDRAWDRDRDLPRIRAAFSTLARSRESWPTPRHFLDALPRVEQKALPYEVKPLPKEEAEKRMADIRAVLAEPVPTFKPAKPEREGPPLVDVEQGLREHYGIDRKSAAAGDA